MEREVIPVWAGPDSMITALGFSTEETLREIERGHIGCNDAIDGEVSATPLVAGRVDRVRLAREAAARGLDGYTTLEQMLLLPLADVIERSGIDPAADDTLFVFSTTKGNIDRLGGGPAIDKRVFLMPTARRAAAHFGARHEPLVVCNACISGVSALIIASRLIAAGSYRHVLVAGADLLTQFVVSGFRAFKSVSERVCRPYDRSRDGLTLGEGGGAILLTADRALAGGDAIRIAGGCITNDANHISGPSRTGDGLHFAIRGALAEAGIGPDGIAFVNGHGTATPYNDEMESKAFHLSGLSHTPLNSLKPYVGHTLGAAGVIETILALHGLRDDVVFATPGFTDSDTPYPVAVSAVQREAAAGGCLKTASGFGGCNAAVVLMKGDTAPRGRTPAAPVRQTARCVIDPAGAPFGDMIRARYKALGDADMKFFKMDDLSKLGYVCASTLLKKSDLHKKYRPEEIGVVLANWSSSLDSDRRHLQIIQKEGEDSASPAVFVYTLPNVVAGEICIRHKIQGESTFFIMERKSADFLPRYARALLENGYLKAVIYGWCELLDETYSAEMTLLEIEK